MMGNREQYGALSAMKDARLAREGFTGIAVCSLTGEYRTWLEGRPGKLFASLLAARTALAQDWMKTIPVVE